MIISNKQNRKILIIGVILFVLTVLFFQIFIIQQEVYSLKGCSPDEYNKMLNDSFRYWSRVLFNGSILGACAGIIVLIIYGLNLFILNIYKNIKTTVSKVIFCLIIRLFYVGIFLYKRFIIMNTIYDDLQVIVHVIVFLIIFRVLMLSYIGLVIHIIVKKIKTQKNRENEPRDQKNN